jgi:hypothetical protein
MKATETCGNCGMRRAHENPAFADFAYLGPCAVNVSASVVSCENQGESNQIKPNPTKSNHYFFQENDGYIAQRLGRCAESRGQTMGREIWRAFFNRLIAGPAARP